MPVAVVTDSSAALPPEPIERYGLTVIPLVVVVDGAEGREGVDVSTSQVARGAEVSTSRPAPAQFTDAYRRLLDAGATGIVSVHLSAELSGTWESATIAAGELGTAVTVVDARSTGMGLGFPALAAAAAAAEGADISAVRDAARATVDRTSTLFYVDSLEFLRRGGRVGAASALLGTALSVKPILHVVDGRIVLRDKVRTASRALARLVDVAMEAAGDSDVDIAVHHVDAPDRAAWIAGALTDRLGDRLKDTYTTEIGAAVAAHVGPGVACVVVHRRPFHNRSTA